MVKELPEAVLQTYAFWRETRTLEECLTETLNGDKIEGFDLVYDDSLVEEDLETEKLNYAMTSIEKLHIWTKTRVLIWEPEWRFFRVFPRNPDKNNKFKIKRDDGWT
jgi:hypothetical protein